VKGAALVGAGAATDIRAGAGSSSRAVRGRRDRDQAMSHPIDRGYQNGVGSERVGVGCEPWSATEEAFVLVAVLVGL